MTTEETTRSQQGSSKSNPSGALFNPKTAWGMTALVVFLYTINYADKAVLGIIAQPLSEELGLKASEIGLVGSLFFLMFTIGGLFAGVLDRWAGLRWALLGLAVVWSVAMLPLVVSASFVVLILTRMLLGLAEGPGSALMHTAVYSWHAPARRGLPGAVLISSAGIANLLFAPILAFVTVKWGWRAAIVSLSLIALVWMVVWLKKWAQGPYMETPADAPESTDGTESAEPHVPWTRIFLNRTFLSCALMLMTAYGMATVVLTWLPSYFEVGLGYSRIQAGSMLTIPALIGLVLTLLAAFGTDKLMQRGVSVRTVRVIAPCLSLLLCSATLVFLPHVGVAGVAVVLVSLGYGFSALVMPIVTAAISELCPPRQTAGTLGVFIAVLSLGGLVGPYATGVIVDRSETQLLGYVHSFQAIGVVAAIAAVVALIFADPLRDRMRIRGI